MINFSLESFLMALTLARQVYRQCQIKQGTGQDVVMDDDKAQFRSNFQFAAQQCARLFLEKADARIQRISAILDRPCSYGQLAIEFKTLMEAIEVIFGSRDSSITSAPDHC